MAVEFAGVRVNVTLNVAAVGGGDDRTRSAGRAKLRS